MHQKYSASIQAQKDYHLVTTSRHKDENFKTYPNVIKHMTKCMFTNNTELYMKIDMSDINKKIHTIYV